MMLIAKRVAIFGLMALVLSLLLEAPTAKKEDCSTPSSCGNIGNISYPFRLKGDPRTCGDIELVCENNRTTWYLLSQKYYVEEISYVSRISILLIDACLMDKDVCSLPCKSFPSSSILKGPSTYFSWVFGNIYFVTCPNPIHVKSLNYDIVNLSTCVNTRSSANSETYFSYATLGISLPTDLPDSCNITITYPGPPDLDLRNISSISYFHQELLRGFVLEWYPQNFKLSFKQRFHLENFYDFWYHYSEKTKWIAFSIAVGLFVERTSIGILCWIIILVYKFRRRHLSMDDTIENFLQSHNNFKPIRYSFSEIKEMTKGFKDKLGQGGYGSVFKGKLRSGHLVAIKSLEKSKANGQDFINEVATIGRIHHVNVVQLIGFCAEGSKQALVYDFMPNGSLDKFIFSKGDNIVAISWERMYHIALGVARGIEYLHRGCEMQILHFDIKPHNILLDENFVPKVSDFGLAKWYSTNDSVVPLTAVRGTLGYIAPELFYKSIGGVSYKADVYSFGKLLMEMVGRRKNTNECAEHSSQIYFPSWIYDRVNQGEEMELEDATNEVKNLARKMTLVALWCIQMKPVDRPSMNEVLDMLERDVELLQIPPKPSFCPQETPIQNHWASLSSSYVDISSTC